MEQHVHAELFGGPEDGRSFIIPAPERDLPIGQLTFPSPRDGEDPCARYDRQERRPDGVWRYRYTGNPPM